jgi:hypothetical protein
MFSSAFKGLKMIFASLKMAAQDVNLLVPSVLTVLSNLGFGLLLLLKGRELAAPVSGASAAAGAYSPYAASPYGMPTHAWSVSHHVAHRLVQASTLNGSFDPSGFGFLGGYINQRSVFVFAGLVIAWWLTNRFLEGVTSMLVYAHLTQGSSKGKFLSSCAAVFSSLPAIIVLGAATFVARRLAGFLQRFRGGLFGLLGSMFAIFWTMAGHLILPAVVIEGTSFIGGLKRAEQIASGNLIAIGVGEVGVDGLCRFFSWLTYLAGAGGFAYAMYHSIPLTSHVVLLGAAIWALVVVAVTALSIYLRAAFFTCLYVWATDAEAVQTTERVGVRPPSPLAAALA